MASLSFGIMQSMQYVSGQGSGSNGIFVPVYDEKTGVLSYLDNCVIAFGRSVHYFGRKEVPSGASGTLYAVIAHPTYGQTAETDDDTTYSPTLTIETKSQGSTNTHTSFPLYTVYGGKIQTSYIGMPFIPVYS